MVFKVLSPPLTLCYHSSKRISELVAGEDLEGMT